MLEHVGAVSNSSLVAGSSAIKTSSPGCVAGRLDRRQSGRLERGLVGLEVGAKPPSSPTAVESPRSCRVLERVEDLGPHPQPFGEARRPGGTTMNSWKSTVLSAWAPPLSTFIIGTGSTLGLAPTAVELREVAVERPPASAAAAFAAASDTPRIALAPSRPLFGVPSSSIIVRRALLLGGVGPPSAPWRSRR